MAMLLTTCTTDISVPVSKIVYNMIASTRTGNTARKTDMVLKYSTKYKLDPFVFTRLGIAESSFVHTSANKVSGARGIYAVHPKYWSHLCWVVCDGKYVNYLNRHNGTNYTKVMNFIGAGTEMGAIILRTYLNQYGDYRSALYQYGGWNAKRYKHRTNQRNKYVNKILVNDSF